ncbi:hypothetical protein ACT43X_18745 (plasmid) [Acinetobacter baumannii]
MKNLVPVVLIASSFLLSACSDDKKSDVSGDNYIGVWVNPQGQHSQSEKDVIVNDRIIIEKSDKENTYSTTILAKGVFTTMTFNNDNGLLCASNDACFQLENGKLRLGSPEGVLTYERENEK